MKASCDLSFNKIWGFTHGTIWWFSMEWPKNISSSGIFSSSFLQFMKIWNYKASYLLPKSIISFYKFFGALFGPIHSVFYHSISLDLQAFTWSLFFFLYLLVYLFLFEYHSRQNKNSVMITVSIRIIILKNAPLLSVLVSINMY